MCSGKFVTPPFTPSSSLGIHWWMSKTFFATDTDISHIWRWLFDHPDIRIVEAYSRPDSANRWFDEWAEIERALESPQGNLAAWPETVGGKPSKEDITFTPDVQRQLFARGRTILHSPAFITVNRNNNQMGCLASTTISYWTENGARQRSLYNDNCLTAVNWPLLRSIAGGIERRLVKSSPAKMRAYPIMTDAFERLKAGEIKLWNWGEACDYHSPLIIEG